MDKKSLEMLEFPHIRNILASYTSFSASHSLALELEPHTNKDEISSLLQQAKEGRHLLSNR